MKRNELAGFKFIVDKGFASELVVEQPPIVLPKPAMVYQEPVIEEGEVPAFFRKRNQAKDNVVYVDFGGQSNREVLHTAEHMVEEVIAFGKKTLQPIMDYFFGEDK